MFVDSDLTVLMSALSGGQCAIPPSILDPDEEIPFSQQPVAEFAKGTYLFQQRLGDPVSATRLARRMAFYQASNKVWIPVNLMPDQVRLAHRLTLASIWDVAIQRPPMMRRKRIGRGEAECAAVAITRGWNLWSDDAAIIELLSVLYPDVVVERISDLLVSAVTQDLLTCEAAEKIYNRVFKQELSLWSRLTASCRDERLVFM